jgi:hypothetical protein
VLAYTFWHWLNPAVSAADYESRLQRFHRVLSSDPPAGFSHSYAFAIHGAPWITGAADAYEDWYIISGSAALDPLNDAATTGSRREAHETAAAAAAGGTAGLYRLRLGASIEPPCVAYWFAKPAGVAYQDLYDALRFVVRDAAGALWGRQMTLGPAPEFCLHAQRECALPGMLVPVSVPLRPVWPAGAS